MDKTSYLVLRFIADKNGIRSTCNNNDVNKLFADVAYVYLYTEICDQ